MFHDNDKSIDGMAHLNKKIERLEQENNALKKKNEQLYMENVNYKNIIRMFDFRNNLTENHTLPYPFNISENINDLEETKTKHNKHNKHETWTFVI